MQLLRHLSITMLLLILTACGGGDGGLGTENKENIAAIKLELSTGTVSDGSPITITATMTENNKAVSGILLNFSITDEEIAFFDPESATAATNDAGIATITLMVGNKAGTGAITATANSLDITSPSVAFDSAGDGAGIGPAKVEEVSLFASTQQLASSGAQEIELTSIVKDANNNLVEGATVSFSADSGQVQVIKAITESDGQATAILKTENEPTNRVINIVATSDLISDEVSVQVIGTVVQVSGSSSLAINDENIYIVKVLDSDGNGIVSTPVTLSLTNNSGANVTLPSTVVTDFTGQATFTAVGTTGGSNTIVATALGASTSQDVTVQSDSFLFTNFNNGNGNFNPNSNLPEVVLSDDAILTLEWLRSGVPVADGTPISFTSTRGTLSSSSASTVNGKVSVNVSSNNAGKALVTFTGVDGAIRLNNQLEFEFIAESVDRIVAQASPTSIGPNEQTSVISVVVKDSNGNLVKNKIIDFSLTDTNGGTIFPASDVTDSNGSASTVYTSNAVSAKNGVSITATVREDKSKEDTIDLTVADRELFLSLGTGNEIEQVDLTTYNKKYAVFVTDVDSTPVENVEIKVSAIPKRYKKGEWIKVFENGEFKSWVADISIQCSNEDLNQDGTLDAGEDINGDNILTPGNIVTVSGEVVTDEDGRAIIDIKYAESYGHWADIDLIVTAKVTGTEYLEKTVFTLPVLGSDLSDEDITPPTQSVGLDGPFGSSASCSNAN